MLTSTLADALATDLGAVLAAVDEQAGALVTRLGPAISSSVRLRLLEAATEAAAEITSQLPQGRVEVRLESGEPVFVFVDDAPPTPAPVPEEEEAGARISLRLPESLKARIDQSAAHEGVSVNTWVTRTVARALEHRPRRGGNRLTGFARS